MELWVETGFTVLTEFGDWAMKPQLNAIPAVAPQPNAIPAVDLNSKTVAELKLKNR